MRAARTRLACIALAATSLLAACGDGDEAAPATVAAAPARASTTAAPTTATPTTAAPTTSTTTTASPTTTTTTVAPTTTVPPTLPVPVAVPADSGGAEPVVDLGTIEIPKVGLSAKMYEGIRLPTLDRGPGHWPGTAMPGQLGNVVVAGHRVSHAKPFRNLDKLAPGDQVIFSTADGRFTYTVTATEIVKPDAVWIVDQTPDHTATLFACHPPGSTRERIVVHLALATG